MPAPPPCRCIAHPGWPANSLHAAQHPSRDDTPAEETCVEEAAGRARGGDERLVEIRFSDALDPQQGQAHRADGIDQSLTRVVELPAPGEDRALPGQSGGRRSAVPDLDRSRPCPLQPGERGLVVAGLLEG